MAKESGLGFTISVDDCLGAAKVIGNDVTSLTLSTPRTVLDVTGICKSAMERILSLADAQITINGVFNDAACFSHFVFKSVSSTDVVRTVALAHSCQTLSMEIYFSDYALTRSTDGGLTWTATGSLATGVAPAWS